MISEEFKGRVLSLRGEGLSRREIAKKLEVQLFRVHRALDGNPLSSEEKEKKRERVWPRGTTEKILSLRREGTRSAEIAEVLGLPITKVWYDLQESDVRVTKPRDTYSADLRKKAVILHSQYLPRKEIAKQLGVALNAVNVMLRGAGVGRIPEEIRLAHCGLRVWPKGTNTKILEMRRMGCSYSEIEKALVSVGITRGKIKEVLHHSSIRFTEGQRISHLPVKYSKNQWEEVVGLRTQGFTFPEIEFRTGVDEGTAADYCSRKRIFLTQEQSLANRRISKGESDVFAFVASICPDAVPRKRGILGRKELDVYVPSLRLGIEYHGLYWHGESWSDDKFNVLDKHLLAQKEEVRLISIFEDEWLCHKQEVKDRVKGVLCGKEKLRPVSCEGGLFLFDNRWSQDLLCRSEGYCKIRDNPPAPWYFKFGYPVRYSPEEFGEWVLGEEKLVKGKNYDKIWDAGSTVWGKREGQQSFRV